MIDFIRLYRLVGKDVAITGASSMKYE